MGNFRTIILDFETIGIITNIKLGPRTDQAQSREEKVRSVRETLCVAAG
jgi:uncharacterized protein YqgV (UPF0045/DUF77 family)